MTSFNHQRILRIFLAFGGVLLLSVLLVVAVSPAIAGPGEINGTVFRDYNDDGTHDPGEPGVSGVTVSAYDGANTIVASDTTDVSGGYSLTGLTDTSTYRIEFSGLASADKPGSFGANNDSSVVFVTSPADGVDFGLNDSADYCQDDPLVSMSCFENGDGLAAGSTNPGYVHFRWSASGVTPGIGGTGSTYTQTAEVQEVGTVWGAAYQRESQRLFTASFLKRHSGFGPRGADGIYVLDYSSSDVPINDGLDLQGYSPDNGGSAIDLGFVCRSASCASDPGNSGVAADYTLPTSATTANWDLDAFGKVGMMSYGDIDITEDDSTLWLVNLYQRALISVDISGTTVMSPTTINQYLIDSMSPPSCAGGVLRPWGLKFHNGLGYLGAVCTAEYSQNQSDLVAHVLSFDPTTDLSSTGFTQVFTISMDYNREPIADNPSAGLDEFQPWAQTWFSTTLGTGTLDEVYWPQPILSDIEFTEDGSMVLGFTDRWGHQGGYENYRAITTDTELLTHDAGGDIIHACSDSTGGWVVEDGNSGTSCASSDTGPGPAGRTDDGPSLAGEYYFEDRALNADVFNLHYEISTGGLALLKGSEQVLTTSYDPVNEGYTQGTQWYTTTTGTRADEFEFVPRVATELFGKANGLGDPELICAPPPLEVGNRLWCDDGDGIQDPDENGVGSGITVTLSCSGDSAVSVQTDASGNYLFTDAIYQSSTNGTNIPRNTACNISVDTTGSNATAIAAVCGSADLTTANSEGDTSNDSISDVRDSDGLANGGTSATVSFTTGGGGSNNHGFDIGFLTGPTAITLNAVSASATGNPSAFILIGLLLAGLMTILLLVRLRSGQKAG